MKNFFFALLCLVSINASAQVSAIVGKWTTIDDKTGEKKSVVEIYQAKDGMYYGKVVKIFEHDEDAVCVACEGADKNAKIIGLNIIRGMKEEDGKLVGGRVLDPDNGKFYYAKIWLEKGKLVLRGSLDKKGFLGRSQTWVK